MKWKTAWEGNCSLKAWMQHNFDVIGNSLSFRQISATALLPRMARKQRNHTERCQKYIPFNKNNFIIFIIIIAIGNSLSFWQISITALLPEKRNYPKTRNHTELSNVYFSQTPKYDIFKLNILISFVHWQCLLLNLDFSAIKITLHCNSFNICCCGTGLAFLLSGSSESSTVKTVKTCFHKKVLSLLVIAVITSSHISISTSFSVTLWHNGH